MRGRWKVHRVAAKLIEVVSGIVFLTPPVQAVWSRLPKVRRDKALTVASAAPRLAVVAHVYYADLIPEILACWAQVSGCARGSNDWVDLHVTTVESRRSEVFQQLRQLLGGHSQGVTIHVSPNRGRDIAPFMKLLNGGQLDGYDGVLKLHTKRSPHLRTGSLRRRLFFTLLAGNARQIRQVVTLFSDPTVGMVGWGWSFRNKPSWWMANESQVNELALRMSPPPITVPGFFEGSMFWVRPQALAPLRTAALSADDFEAEDGQLDGCLHHAIERMFTLSAWAAGYKVCAITGKELHPGPSSTASP
jgi:lipopolysaccharide biosynthesis protein